MTEFEMIRNWLLIQATERKLNEIARQTGINRRTIQRIVNEPAYSVTSPTSAKLKRCMDLASEQSVTA